MNSVEETVTIMVYIVAPALFVLSSWVLFQLWKQTMRLKRSVDDMNKATEKHNRAVEEFVATWNLSAQEETSLRINYKQEKEL